MLRPNLSWRCLAALLFLPLAATASDAGFERCAGLGNPDERLACYDAAASMGRAAVPTAVETAPAAPSPADPVQQFGAEALPRPKTADDSEPDSIRSRLPGRFEGWGEGTLFRLENGQVWRCINCRTVFLQVRDNPEVTIKRNFLGSYWLSVEGLNTAARVRRVE